VLRFSISSLVDAAAVGANTNRLVLTGRTEGGISIIGTAAIRIVSEAGDADEDEDDD
jgi:hypothetical protein